MLKCLECGSKNIHIISYNTEHVRASMLEPANRGVAPIKNGDLPYILGGHYCCECQRMISVYDDEPFDEDLITDEPEQMASAKQKKFIEKLLGEWERNPAYRSEYKDLKYDTLTQSFATTIIDDLLAKQKANPMPKRDIPHATDKQISLIKRKLSEDATLAEKYKNLNYEKLNVVTASKIISEIIK